MRVSRAGVLAAAVLLGGGGLGLYAGFGPRASAPPVDGSAANRGPATASEASLTTATITYRQPARPEQPKPAAFPVPPAPSQPLAYAPAEPLPGVIDAAAHPRRAIQVKSAAGPRGLVILQIGDSHTAADFFTGEVRRRLQSIYGAGGTGPVTAGRPHVGVLSASLKSTMSPGWTYQSLQKSDDASEFWLSGFNAVATSPRETMTLTAPHPVTFDSIEIEAVSRPGGGSIDISLDGAVESSFDLASEKVEPIVIRLRPQRGPTDRVSKIVITTRGEGPVSISSVAIYHSRSGVTLSSIGYPGATVGIVNKLDERLFADDLRRINPHIVVLAFGTNEASKPKFDARRYAGDYQRVVAKIKAALPSAVVVLVGPPDGAELPPQCKDKAREAAVCLRTGEPKPKPAPASAVNANQPPAECVWKSLPHLESVRDVQRDIAQRQSLVYWNWASIMPSECGADRWATLSPPLMAKDRVHFTIDGYKKSAAQFLTVLIPIIEKLRASPDVVSNN